MTAAVPAAGPLAGVRVIDMTSVGMGPYATQILGDMGAEIIKIEAPEGDVFRASAPAASPGMGAVYLNLNRNKRSVTLNAKDPDDLRRLLRLVDDADVFISNVRPRAGADRPGRRQPARATRAWSIARRWDSARTVPTPPSRPSTTSSRP